MRGASDIQGRIKWPHGRCRRGNRELASSHHTLQTNLETYFYSFTQLNVQYY